MLGILLGGLLGLFILAYKQSKEIEELKQRIDKAINVLEKLQDWNYYDGLTCEQVREPLEILKGDVE